MEKSMQFDRLSIWFKSSYIMYCVGIVSEDHGLFTVSDALIGIFMILFDLHFQFHFSACFAINFIRYPFVFPSIRFQTACIWIIPHSASILGQENSVRKRGKNVPVTIEDVNDELSPIIAFIDASLSNSMSSTKWWTIVFGCENVRRAFFIWIDGRLIIHTHSGSSNFIGQQ